ncbi:MAG: hypothetical protein JNM69_24060 [Archangium sp.]|nr:hypothetical protein [Archangium sp.]
MVRLVLLALAAEPAFVSDGTADGVTIEKREVAGSSFFELRLTATTTKATLEALCDEAWGDGSYDPTEPDLKARKVLSADAGVRVTWEEIAPAVVSPRDYVLYQTVDRTPTTCTMRYRSTSDPAAPVRSSFVRITRLWGSWHFEALPSGGVRVVYTSFSDPGGSIPAFLVKGPQRSAAIMWMKRTMDRAAARH